MRLLTQHDIKKIFNISNTAVTELVHSGRLPYKSIDGNNFLFCADTIIKFIENPNMNDEKYIARLRNRLWEANPTAMQAFQEFGLQHPDPWSPKKFYLDKVKNKKLGFVYYVRYSNNGIIIPSHWTTKTNDRQEAEKYAEENRERLLSRYFKREKIKKPYGEMYSILRKYYSKDSAYLQIDIKRGRSIAERSRLTYHNFINKRFIPFLKKNGVKDFEDIHPVIVQTSKLSSGRQENKRRYNAGH